MCPRTTRAGFRCVAMPQDSKRAKVARLSTSKTYYGQTKLGYTLSQCATWKQDVGIVCAHFAFKHLCILSNFYVPLFRVSIEMNEQTNNYSYEGRPPLYYCVTGKICAVYAYYAQNMQKYAHCAINMQQICWIYKECATKYVTKYAKNIHKTCLTWKNMKKYAKKYVSNMKIICNMCNKICNKICNKNATNVQKIARNTIKYAKLVIYASNTH